MSAVSKPAVRQGSSQLRRMLSTARFYGPPSRMSGFNIDKLDKLDMQAAHSTDVGRPDR